MLPHILSQHPRIFLFSSSVDKITKNKFLELSSKDLIAKGKKAFEANNIIDGLGLFALCQKENHGKENPEIPASQITNILEDYSGLVYEESTMRSLMDWFGPLDQPNKLEWARFIVEAINNLPYIREDVAILNETLVTEYWARAVPETAKKFMAESFAETTAELPIQEKAHIQRIMDEILEKASETSLEASKTPYANVLKT